MAKGNRSKSRLCERSVSLSILYVVYYLADIRWRVSGASGPMLKIMSRIDRPGRKPRRSARTCQ